MNSRVMYVQRVFAQIQDGIIKDLKVADDFEFANWLTRATYGEDAVAVEITYTPARIGDQYRGGQFFREEDGEEIRIDPTPTPEQLIEQLAAKVEYLSLQQEVDLSE